MVSTKPGWSTSNVDDLLYILFADADSNRNENGEWIWWWKWWRWERVRFFSDKKDALKEIQRVTDILKEFEVDAYDGNDDGKWTVDELEKSDKRETDSSSKSFSERRWSINQVIWKGQRRQYKQAWLKCKKRLYRNGGFAKGSKNNHF